LLEPIYLPTYLRTKGNQDSLLNPEYSTVRVIERVDRQTEKSLKLYVRDRCCLKYVYKERRNITSVNRLTVQLLRLTGRDIQINGLYSIPFYKRCGAVAASPLIDILIIQCLPHPPVSLYGMFSFTNATRESRDSCSVFMSFSDFRYAPNAFSKVSLSEIKSSGSSYKSQICRKKKERGDIMLIQLMFMYVYVCVCVSGVYEVF
jgi:hypothetical protein